MPLALYCLPKLDPESEEFDKLFRSFLSSKEGRADVLALSGEDAKLFIEIIDGVRFSRTPSWRLFISSPPPAVKVFQAARLEAEPRQLAFNILRKLCGKIGHLPESYLLSDEFDLSGLPRASGGFADIRTGVFRGETVVVKSLRIAEVDDKARIRKVRDQAAFSHLGLLMCRAALL